MTLKSEIKKRTTSRRYEETKRTLPTHKAPSNDEKKPRSLPLTKVNWDAFMRSGNGAQAFWVTITLVVFALFSDELVSLVIFGRGNLLSRYQQRVVFRDLTRRSSRLWRDSLPKLDAEDSLDFGDLEFTQRKSFNDPISVPDNDYEMAEDYRSELLQNIDEDGRQADKCAPLSDKEDELQECQVPSWMGYTFPTCNHVHELPTGRPYPGGWSQDYDVKYLSSGAYRDAWKLTRSDSDNLVLKRLKLRKHSWGSKDVYKIHKEAIILERMSPSPRVLDIYGACGTSVLVETMRSDLHTLIITGNGVASQQKLNRLDNVKPLNDFSASEKLQIALSMAESLADLHGYIAGTITHADTHIEQWLIAPDGSIKLNDFNNAREPEWNYVDKAYCLRSGSFGGVYRSPEEFSGGSQDESIDIYALGSNIYTMLTGLWPFYDEEFRRVSHDQIRESIVKGARPFIDRQYRSRSYIEGKLVEIIESCWAQNRHDRPSVFQVVDLLRETKRQATKVGELQSSKLIKIPMLNS